MKTHLKPIAKWFAASLITVGAGALSTHALAATSAGQEIKNQANVTFEDQYGNVYQSTSNDAIVTVAQIYSATLIADRNTTGSAGQTVYLPHTLTNTGNGLDTYTLTFQDVTGTDSINTVPSTLEVILDLDGDGVAEPGEPVFSSGDTIDIPGGEQRELLIKAVVPTTALANDTLGVTIMATGTSGPVFDEDGNADNTNTDLITITDNAVLNTTKSATHLENVTNETALGIDIDGDTGNNLPLSLIRYTVTISNTGNTAAKNVNVFDGIPEGTYIVDASSLAAYNLSSSGFITANGDTPVKAVANIVNEGAADHGVDLDHDGVVDNTDESDIATGLDLNQNGTTTDAVVPGVVAIDDQLAPGATISMTFHVAYAPELVPGGTLVHNKAYVCADLNGDGDYTDAGECNDTTSPNPGPGTSNKTTTETTVLTDVLLTDTGSESGVSGGGDNDTTGNDIQEVASSAAGSDVFFYNIVTNKGNTVDSFDLSNVSSSFPMGTTFEYWTADGSAQLTDSNGNNIPDTGPISAATCTDPNTFFDADTSTPPSTPGIELACNQIVIRVIAKLPANAASSTAPFETVIKVTSDNDPSEVDTVTDRLLSVTLPTVDIANTPIEDIDATDNLDPVNLQDGFNEADVATRFEVSYGTTVDVPLYIANEGGSSDSFLLSAEGSYNTGTSTWDTSLPDGWTVVFKHGGIDTDADGTLDIPGTGNTISATPTIPAGAVFWVTAKVTIPADPAKALANSDQDYAINANPDVTPPVSGTDADLDYIISMVAKSTTSGATDRKVEAFDVTDAAAIEITPTNLSNQVEKGGRVDYEHTLTNTGNTTEEVDLSSSNNETGFNNTIRIDVDGDNVPDIELGNLCSSTLTSPITVDQGDGTTKDIEFTCDSPTDAVPSLNLEPGEKLPLFVSVFAPSDAAENTTNITTILAETDDPNVSAQAQDNTKIVEGQVRLLKYADIDANCDGTPDAPNSFLKIETTPVAPGECIVWKLIAINEGDVDAQNVVITDNLTDFTQFKSSGNLVACKNTTDVSTIVTPGTIGTAAVVGPPAVPAVPGYPLQIDNEGPLCMPSSATGAGITKTQTGASVKFEIPALASGDVIVAHFLVEVE